MFNRYWRTYPWWLQLSLAFLLVFTLSSFATYIVLALVPRMSGVAFKDLVGLTPASPAGTVRAGLIAQAITHIGFFTAPALLFAAFTHPRMREYLGLRRPGRPVHWMAATGIMLGLLPVFLWGEALMMEHLQFGQWAADMQRTNDNTVKAFLKLRGGADPALLFFVLALLPAFGEELLFRGVLLRLLHRRVYSASLLSGSGTISGADAQRGMAFPVMVTALVFALIHFNPYGFAFIFIAGCILALIYYLTGSLLCSMWAHFLYNGTQVAAAMLSGDAGVTQKVAEIEQIPIIYPLIGLLIFAGSFYALVRSQTPLRADWSTDFRPGEN